MVIIITLQIVYAAFSCPSHTTLRRKLFAMFVIFNLRTFVIFNAPPSKRVQHEAGVCQLHSFIRQFGWVLSKVVLFGFLVTTSVAGVGVVQLHFS